MTTNFDDCITLDEDIPILDEHTVNYAGKTLTIDEKVLLKICNNQNRRVEETGDEVPIVIGHTIDGAPEKDQPEIIGYASHFRVLPLKKTKRKAIFCRWRILKDKMPLLRRYPRRSVELWLSKMEIDPISLLGASTPERNLGLIRYNKQGTSYSYSLEEGNMEKDEIVKEVLAQLEEQDWVKLLKNLAEELKEALSEEKEPPEVSEEEPVKEEGASATNTYIPESVGRDEKEVYQRSLDSLRIKLSRYEAQTKALETEVSSLRKKYQRVEREKDLVQLEAEGYLLDRNEELDSTDSLSDDSFKKHLDLIRKRYQKAPLSKSIIIPASGRISEEDKKEKTKKAVELATKKNLSWDDAWEQVNGEQVF